MLGGAEESDAKLLSDKGERTKLFNIGSTEKSEKETFRSRVTEQMVGSGVNPRELLRVQNLQDNKGGRLMSLLTDFSTSTGHRRRLSRRHNWMRC